MDSVILTVRQLSVVHAGRVVLRPFDWTVRAGERWALLGVNGSGKSSLLHALLGVQRAVRECVTLVGVPLSAMSVQEQARRRVYVPQRYDEPFTVTVWQALCSMTEAADDARRLAALETFGLLARRHDWLHTLSGGERQRLTWAFADVRRGSGTVLALYDEPCSAQDLSWQQRLLAYLNDTPYSVIAAIHDLNHAAAFATHVMVLGAGEVLAQGRLPEVMRSEVLTAAFGVTVVCEGGFWRAV